MARLKGKRKEEVVRSSGNVFADLGFADAEERRAKVRLAAAINQLLPQRRRSQTEVARKLGVNQPKVSALLHYKLKGFSVERLMRFLTALDQDIQIVIRSKPRSRRAARIVVTAAPAAVRVA